MIPIIILIGGLVLLCSIIVLLCRHFGNSIDQRQSFEIAKQAVIKNLEAENEKRIAEEKQKIQIELSAAMTELNAKKRECQNSIDELQKDISAAKERRDNQLKELAQSLAKEIEQKSKEGAIQLQSIVDYYNNQKTNIAEDFQVFTEEIFEKKVALETELKKVENKQKEIIEEYKRAEQIRQDRNFYRIVISEDNLDDVHKLRSIAKDLHNPSLLYKLIYKEYYEKPFNEMIGRVITGRGNTGIYKITNLINGRVYIGQTRQAFKTRWLNHLKKGLKADNGGGKLYDAMWEDGIENFTWEVLAECDTDDLNEKEREYIAFYHADTWGYNSNKGVSKQSES